MMREQFPVKKVGDRLAAKHVNDLSKVASRFGRLTNAGFMHIHHGHQSVNMSGFPPFKQFILTIYDTKIDANDDADSGLYRVRVRYYDHADAEWKTDDDTEYELDGTEFDMTGLEVDDKVVAFWHQQRGMFVPCQVAIGVRMVHGTSTDNVLETDADIDIQNVRPVYGKNPVNGTGTNADQILTVQNVHGFDGDLGGRVTAVYCNDEDQWEAIQMDCGV
jgi:hypothetical protein